MDTGWTSSESADTAAQRTSAAIRTTDGVIALRNLHAQIAGLEEQAARGRAPSRSWIDLIDLLLLRGELLGRITDYERATALAEYVVGEAPAEGWGRLSRARTRSTFHCFADALADLDRADRLGVPKATLNAERVPVLHQLGRGNEALSLAQETAHCQPGFTTLAGLAILHAEREDVEAAEIAFAESRALYRQVSPFPLALLDFQRGRMWMRYGDHLRAHDWFVAAVQRLPGYAPAQGHLAEVEAALGNRGSAMTRLRPLAVSADDPDYATQLARMLKGAGQDDESQFWCAHAAARYDELMARHPEAYADHAAEFWLGVGGDPKQALRLARWNADLQHTPRADELLAHASLASQAIGEGAPPPAARE